MLVISRFAYSFANFQMQSWHDFFEIRNGTDGVLFLIDEIHSEFSTAASKDFPESLLSEMSQQRKQRIKICGTAQVYSRFFSCSLIKKYEKCAAYVSKYVTKDLAAVALGRRVVLASEGLNRPELVFDCDEVPCVFKPEYQDDFCKIAWLGDAETIGTFVPEGEGEFCNDLHSIYEDDAAAAIFVPLTGSQLKI